MALVYRSNSEMDLAVQSVWQLEACMICGMANSGSDVRLALLVAAASRRLDVSPSQCVL